MYVFYVVLVTNIGYFIYSFNWRFLITELECVYCAVRTRTLNVIQVKFCLQSVESNGKISKVFNFLTVPLALDNEN